ncbi:MAG: ADP/ATP-dependent (S)-NAD(P)H-hydrate dehydratase [Rothia sp. (in: high G+C Gram-positive bacteria)]|nr:ADP/ATP-dependent (S)-NAD(P)H-hydrate dehydratase [Rothia sp. (in: high G+C Gram-positive bacteria)]
MTQAQPLNLKDCRQVLQAPQRQSHKYSRGVVGLITGSPTYPGAALLSTEAAIMSGAGMVRFLGPADLLWKVQLKCPEAVTSSQEPSQVRVEAWGIGSGAVGEERARPLLEVISSQQPAVIDAAALPLTAQALADGLSLGPQQILTPHAGEAVDFITWLQALAPQLLTIGPEPPSRSQLEEKPLYYAQALAQATGATVLIKGGVSSIASPQGPCYQVSGNTPWLATAGSGDTLTGLMATLLAGFQAQLRGPSGDPGLGGAEDYALIAGAATLIHGLAAELVHDGQLPGPVPPSLVTQQLPYALARALGG